MYIKEKFEYKAINNLIESLYPEIKSVIDNLYKEIHATDLKVPNYIQLNASNEELLEIIKSFFYSLNDTDITKSLDYILKENLLDIREYEENNPECKIYQGYVRKDNKTKKIETIVIYRKHTLDDLLYLVHELGHAVTIIITNNKTHPIFTSFICENDALFFEQLFFKNYLNNPENLYISYSVLAYRIAKMIQYIWDIKILQLKYSNPILYYNLTTLNNKLIENEILPIGNEDLNFINNSLLVRYHNEINSYLLALEQAKKYTDDPEIGLYEFKAIRKESVDEFSSLEKLYKKYHINYPKNRVLLRREINIAKKFQRINEG